MSASITEPALPRMRLPMMNSGTSTSMPQRMPTWSAIQPMSGSTIKSGDDPQRRDREAGRPCARRDRQRERDEDARARAWPATRRCTQLKTTAIHDVRRDRERDRSDRGRRRATVARKRIRPRMSPMNRRVTMRAPMTRPTSWNGSAIAAAMPRARSSRPNSCSYSSDGERDEADQRGRRGTAGSTRSAAGCRSSAPCASSRRTTARSPRWR